MIKINGDEVKIEHFPDGTQRLNMVLWKRGRVVNINIHYKTY